MVRCLASILAFGVVAATNAQFIITFDDPFPTISAPTSGSVTLSFTGTVDVLTPFFEVDNVTGELPALLPGGPFPIDGIIPLAFADYIFDPHPGEDFTGVLIELTIDAGTPDGNYWFNDLVGSDDSELMLSGTGLNGGFSQFAPYGVSIASSVPEPASLAALGAGALALLRRKKKA